MLLRPIRLILCVSVFLMHLFLVRGEDSWIPLGPNSGTIFSMIRDPFASNQWYVGTYFGGMYKTVDAGSSWHQVPSPFSTEVVFSLAADPSRNGRIFAGTLSSGIYETLNAGDSWQKVTNGLGNASIEAIAFDPFNAQTILAGAFEGVYRSTDSGTNWSLSNGGVTNLAARTLLFDEKSEGVVFAGTSGVGVFRSTDHGTTWKAYSVGLGQTVVNDLSADSTSGAIYAASNQGVYRLSLGSNVWENLSFNLGATNVNQVLAVEGNVLLAATDKGLFRLESPASTNWVQWGTFPARKIFPGNVPGSYFISALFDSLLLTYNDGKTFIPADTGIQNRFVGSLTTLNASGQTVLYAGTDYGVEFTSEAFRTNSLLPWISGGRFSGGVFAVTAAGPTSNTLFAAIERDGVWRGRNYGTQWTRTSEGLLPRVIHSLSQSSVGNKTLFAGTTDGLYISTNNGANWSPDRNTRTPHAVTAVQAHPLRAEILFYGTSEGNFYRSFDDGQTAQLSWHTPNGEGISQIAIAPFFNLYLVSGLNQLYVSTDEGANFFPKLEIKEPVLSVAADPARPWMIYAGTSLGGVYRSTNNAIDWKQSNSGLKVPIAYSIAIDPTNTSVLYAGSLGKVYVSTNSADSWQETGPGLSSGAVLHLEIDPAQPSTLYASMANGAIYCSSNSGTNWTLLNSPGEGSGLPLLVSRFDTNMLIAGTLKSGVVRSLDQGQSWAASNDGMTIFIKCLAIDPQNSLRMYAGSLVDGIFRSLDGGTNWSAMGLADRAVYGVAVDPLHPANIHLATSSGIASSHDFGATWFDRGQQTAFIFDLLNNPSDPDQMFISGGSGDFFKSPDGGNSWTSANNGLPGANLVSIVSDWNGGLLYAAAEREGIYKSSDGGKTWSATNQSNLADAPILALGFDEKTGNVLAGSDGHGVFISTNKGASWSSQGLTNRDQVNGFAFNLNQDFIYAATSAGITRSSDHGKSWADIGQRAAYILQMLVDPRDRNTIYVGSIGGQIYRSSDGGNEWTSAGAGLPELSIFALALNSSNGVLYTSPERGGVYRSSNSGSTWLPTDLSVLRDAKITSLTVNPSRNEVFAATDGNGLFISRNGGDTWQQAGLTNYDQIFSITVDAQNPDILYASTSSGFLESTDDGRTWGDLGQKEPYILQLVSDAVRPGTLYASSYAGKLYQTLDSGAHWRLATNGLPQLSIFALGLDTNNGVLYACPERDGIYASFDAGSYWTRIDDSGMSNALVTGLVVENGTGKLYATTAGSGLLASEDGGQIWVTRTNGLQSTYLSSLSLDPLDSSILYATTLSETRTGAALYRSTDSGLHWIPLTNGITNASLNQVILSATPGRLFALSSSNIFRSDDFGQSWSETDSGLGGLQLRTLYAQHAEGTQTNEMILAGTTNGVFRSLDNGLSWHATLNVSSNATIQAFASNGTNIFAATLGNGVWSSGNSGATWAGGLNPRLANPVVFSITQDATFTNTLYGVVTRDGVVKSTNGGITWQIANTGIASSNVISFAIQPGTHRLFAGTSDNGLFVSDDQAATWKPVASEFPALNISYIAPGTGSAMYVATLGHGLLKTTDGLTLTGGVLPELINPLLLGVANSPLRPQYLYSPLDPFGVIRSTNGGLTWRYASQGLDKVRVRKIAIDPVDPDRLVASSFDSGIFWSSDAGQHWNLAVTESTNINATTISTIGPGGIYFAGTLGNGLIISTNRGSEWKGATTPDIVKPIVLGISVDPKNPNKLFAATSGNGALISTNAGISWIAANTGLEDSILFAFAVDPVESQNVYVATSSKGVFASANGGQSWSALNNGLFNKVVTSITIDVNDHRTVYAGTEGGGVFRLTRELIAPYLRMEKLSDAIVLSWPTNAVDFKLERKSALGTPNWSAYDGNVFGEGSQWKLRLTNTVGQEYFRLKK